MRKERNRRGTPCHTCKQLMTLDASMRCPKGTIGLVFYGDDIPDSSDIDYCPDWRPQYPDRGEDNE